MTHIAIAPPPAYSTRADQGFLSRIRRLHWTAVAATVGVTTLFGLGVAFVMPRGPITSTQALGLTPASLLLGLVGGLVVRSRWAMFLVPAVFIIAFELGRWGTPGPTVRSLQQDSTYGVLAFVLGRVLLVLTGLLPMLLGASVGAALARRGSDAGARPEAAGRRTWLFARRTMMALSAVGLVRLATVIAQPGTTPEILGPDGRPLAASIATLEAVQIGGHEQWIMIRGHSTEKPVLLSLTSGPGQTDLPFARVLWEDLERDFVVVDWDQRGTGKSYPALDQGR